MRVVLPLVLALAGCTEFYTSNCTDDLSYRVSPTTRILAVNESFTPSAEFRGCRGSKHLDDVITWSTDNPGVVSVNATTGQVTGLSIGLARVTATGAKYGVAVPPVEVTVQ